MLSKEEKAYCKGLAALRKNDFATADKEFEICAKLFGQSEGFKIIAEATHLLTYLRRNEKRTEKEKNDIKEINTNGKETVICGQGVQEETG